jgi:hypothetical protein
MSEAAPTRRHRFQFGLGTIFVAVTILALLLVYQGKVRWIRERRELLARKEASALIWPEGRAPGFLWLLGEPAYLRVGLRLDLPHPMTASEEAEETWRLKRLFPEAKDVLVSDAGL